MIPPQPPLDVADATQNAEFLDVRAGGEVMTAHAHCLRGDFRRALERCRGLAPDGLAEHHDRAQHEHDERVNYQQAAVAHLAPQQRCHREVGKQTVPFKPGGHRSVSRSAVQCRLGKGARRSHQRTGREMLHRHRCVLKRGMQVG